MGKSSVCQVASCQQLHKLLLSVIVAAEEVNRRGECFQTPFTSQIFYREENTMRYFDVWRAWGRLQWQEKMGNCKLFVNINSDEHVIGWLCLSVCLSVCPSVWRFNISPPWSILKISISWRRNVKHKMYSEGLV
jgi:hypothetical protein